MGIGVELGFGIAFFSGLASFFSPCLLPMIPAYVMFMAGSAMEEGEKISRKRAIIRTLAFVLGFTLVFLLLGLSASVFGRFFVSNKLLFQQVAGLLIVVLGLQFLGVFKFSVLGKSRQFKIASLGNSIFGSFLMGLAFGAGWTPCFGPVLASILMMASASQSVFQGLGLLLIYAFGMGIPFIVTAVFINEVTPLFAKISRQGIWIERTAGVLLILFGVLMMMNWLVKLNYLF